MPHDLGSCTKAVTSIFARSQSICSSFSRKNLSFGLFPSKIGNFSVRFRTFVLENSRLTIPFEQMHEICLETLPIFVAKKPKTQVHNSTYALFAYIISDIAQEGLEIFLNWIAKAIHEKRSQEIRRAWSEMISKKCVSWVIQSVIDL